MKVEYFNRSIDDSSDEWGFILIDETRSGTHENYNVVHNSDCRYEYFDSLAKAIKEKQRIEKEYILNNLSL